MTGMILFAGPLSAAVPPGGGTISIEPKIADGEYDSTMPFFVSAVTEALASKGFTILEDSGHAAYVAELILSRVSIGTSLGKAPAGNAKVMPGAAPGVGAGVAIPLSTGNSSIAPLLRTRIELRIRQRGQAAVVWDGAALTVRADGTRKGKIEVIASDLSTTLLNSYPAQPLEDVGVP